MSHSLKEIAERIRVSRIERMNNANARRQAVGRLKNDVGDMRKKFQDDLERLHREAAERTKTMATLRAQFNDARKKDAAELMQTIHAQMQRISDEVKDEARQVHNMLIYAKDHRLMNHEELMSDIKNTLKYQHDAIETNKNEVKQTARHIRQRTRRRTRRVGGNDVGRCVKIDAAEHTIFHQHSIFETAVIRNRREL
jgi:chromosome segregation ATPase